MLLNPTSYQRKLEYATALELAQTYIINNLSYSPMLTSFELTSLKQTPMLRTQSSETQSVTVNTTSIILNPSDGFLYAPSNQHDTLGSAHLIMTMSDSRIFVYSPLVNDLTINPLYQGYTSIINPQFRNVVYTSVAVINDQLYATDMSNRVIDAYNFQFAYLDSLSQAFIDPIVPDDYTPVNIVAVGSHLYIVYNQLDFSDLPDLDDPDNTTNIHTITFNKVVAGSGLGMIRRYQPDGTEGTTVAISGNLNAPWGLTALPLDRFAVANRGDGSILIYNSNWRVLSRFESFPGLWGIAKHPHFGNQLLCCVNDTSSSTTEPKSALIRTRIR